MELVTQHTKKIMEGCKERARDAGLRFEDETLEYIVTNRDLIELSPKIMIPTLYDYWVHDVEVLREKGKYELYPGNPYETVINTRPAISFYNDNNPDWLNVMIFYHVIAHIDFFQNNLYFRNTWDDDFAGQALSDKRLIAGLRSEKGRWLDYVIEFSRGVDNLVGYFETLSRFNRPKMARPKRLDYYFDVFLQSVKKLTNTEYLKEIERYNDSVKTMGDLGEYSFFLEVIKKYPEFEALFKKNAENGTEPKMDLLQYLTEYSEFLKKEKNKWMNSVIQVVRKTSLFFQPQIRTKIMNEGWSSYWHETLFLQDDRISGHEVEFARVNAGVTSMPRVGLNPYALGMRLFFYLEEMSDKGRYSIEFQKLADADSRNDFDKKTGQGKDFIYRIREDFCDFTFINTFIDQDFIDRNKLFVAGKRLSEKKMSWEYYVKSRKAEDYRQMIMEVLYHPPHIEVSENKGDDETLYLVHHFEEKPLVEEFISNTMLGIEYLWGGPVQLETSEVESIMPVKQTDSKTLPSLSKQEKPEEHKVKWRRMLYTMKDRKLSKKTI